MVNTPPASGPGASPWHLLTVAEALRRQNVDAERGLTADEVQSRLTRFGPNALVERGLKSPWKILWEQLTATMVVILIVAAIISAFLGDYKDCVAILAIVVLNALLGLNQEYRAEKAMAALKRLAVPTVKVRRGGRVVELPARDLVPGDILVLETGNLIPADARLIESVNLRIQEAALTGESEPVEKQTGALSGANLPLGDRTNMTFMGTVITYGRSTAVVTATGMETELGRIATMIQSVEREPTPLQKRMDQLGKKLAIAALAIVVIIFALGLMRGERLKDMFLTAVSMAVAAIPEGLPAVVTIALALGAQRMLRRRALIRKLPAVETLGSVTVICSDKTGTLTENRMTVTVLDVLRHRLDVIEHLREATPVLAADDPRMGPLVDRPALTLLLAAGALCNDAVIRPREGTEGFETIGDPTEGALLVAAARFGLWKAELDRIYPRADELPFDSDRKRMTTVHRRPAPGQVPAGLAALEAALARVPGGRLVALTKGSVDGLVSICRHVLADERTEPLSAEWRARIMASNEELASSGMRVLGVALRALEAPPEGGARTAMEQELTFIGLVAMIDPPRSEVKVAVETCRRAGIRPVMITGDHPLTALYIARELGIATSDRIVTGVELAAMVPAELERVVDEVSVYARVSPEHKLNIVQALQARGHVVAMTGDGVNDAPALKKSDIGVAMGITGTDVSKEAADMVLQDDNFATIVAAVEEGRVIYENIRKFVKYLLATNSGELWVMLIAPFLGMPLPLLPLQILWMNLVTDGLPALALGLEPAERHTMRRPPHPIGESILARGLGLHVIWVGLLMAVISLGMGYWAYTAEHAHWQTMVFTTLTLTQIGHVLAIRSDRDSFFRIGPLSNKPLLVAAVITVGLQLALLYVPFLQSFFHTAPLSALELGISVGLASILFWAVELEKWIKRRTAPERA